MSRTTYAQWYSNLPIPWLVGGPNGKAEAQTWPAALDSQAILLDAARKVAFPDYAPSDALPHLGGDRKLIQGPAESTASFITRCKDPWSQWARAGTARSVLEQVAYFTQSNNATWVQQNGLAYTLTGMPTPGVDPIGLVSTSNLSATSTILTSTVAPYRTIPAGTPWFAFDGNTDMCNRFALIFTSWPFSTLLQANFNNTDSVALTWPAAFASSTYSIIIGPPSANVTLYVDGTTQTQAGVTIRSSAPWFGSVPVIAFASGVNPLNFFTTSTFGALQSVIAAFKPNAICMGVFLLASGNMLGFSGITLGSGATLGGTVISKILGSF